MNYDSMSLVELKQVAKTRRIKMYYTKKRHELIRLMSMPDLPDSFKIEKLTIVQLREEAKNRGMRGFWGLSRDDMVQLLYPDGQLCKNVHKEAENSQDTEKCKDPQPYDSD
jgi:hypothetical protein